MRFANRIVVLTGAGRGIGFEAAKLFASEGAKLMLAGRIEAALKSAVQAAACIWRMAGFRRPDVECSPSPERA